MNRMNREDVELYIEIRGIYDGWSVAKMKDGTLLNRWEPDDSQYAAVQEWIARYKDRYA